MRAIIVGGGIMGLCTAWALCRSGHEAVLYEQGPIPNPLASSYDEHRLTRFTYGAMTGYARMVHEAHAAWDRLWADLGQSHFQPTGTLVVARDEDGWARASQRCLEAMGLPLEIWPPGELAARLPFLRFEGACASPCSRRPAACCSPSASSRDCADGSRGGARDCTPKRP